MKGYVSHPVNTTESFQLLDLTDAVDTYLRSVHADTGRLIIFVPHTTAAVTINENADPDVPRDICGFLRSLIPKDWGFRHREGNSDAHILSSLVGVSLTVLVAGGSPVLGTWQSVFFAEFDGPRNRRILFKFISD